MGIRRTYASSTTNEDGDTVTTITTVTTTSSGCTTTTTTYNEETGETTYSTTRRSWGGSCEDQLISFLNSGAGFVLWLISYEEYQDCQRQLTEGYIDIVLYILRDLNRQRRD